jgi:hypothetical protein
MCFALVDFILILAAILFIIWILNVAGVFVMAPGILYTLIVISAILLLAWIILRLCSNVIGLGSSRYHRNLFGGNRGGAVIV